MGKGMDSRCLQIEEAAKNLEWVEKCRNAGTVEEYAALYAEKGLELSAQGKGKLVEHFLRKSREGKLEDDQLEQATGGYGSTFDGCAQRYEYGICLRSSNPIFGGLVSNCPDLSVVGEEKEEDNFLGGYTLWIIVSCGKGYFQNVKYKSAHLYK
jgi:hypothetical protein